MIVHVFRKMLLHGEELFAPATEGIYSVEIANAMIMAGIQGKTVDLPLDQDAYEDLLTKLITESDAKKNS